MPSAKFQIERKCELCGNTFYAKTITPKYCSDKCSKSAHAQKKMPAKVEALIREKNAHFILLVFFLFVIAACAETRYKPLPVTVDYISSQIDFIGYTQEDIENGRIFLKRSGELIDSGYLKQEFDSEKIGAISFVLFNKTDSLLPEDSLFIFLDRKKNFITGAKEVAVEFKFFEPSKKPYYTMFNLNGEEQGGYTNQIVKVKDTAHE